MICTINDQYFLRPLRPTDADELQMLANNRNIWLNVRDVFPHPYTLKDAHEFIDKVKNDDPPNVLAIATMERFLGCIGLTFNQDIHRVTAELGYWIGESYWRKGIASISVKRFVKYGFDTFDITRIQAGVLEWNRSSMRVLEKCGFTLDGIFRQAVIKDGRICDYFIYSILKERLTVTATPK